MNGDDPGEGTHHKGSAFLDFGSPKSKPKSNR